MEKLKERISENSIDYILVGAYYIPDLKSVEGVTEELKARNQLEWVILSHLYLLSEFLVRLKK